MKNEKKISKKKKKKKKRTSSFQRCNAVFVKPGNLIQFTAF